MPTYEYRCLSCEHQFERFQRMSDDPVKECEICGASVKRLMFPVAIHFKGNGFYSTDYARRNALGSSGGSTGNGGDSGNGDGSGNGGDPEKSSPSENAAAGGADKAKPASPASSASSASSGSSESGSPTPVSATAKND